MHKTGLGADKVRRVSQGKGSRGLDDFGTLHMTAMLAPHDLPTTSLTYFVTWPLPWRTDQATRMAQAARPVINPIGGLPKLLRTFETDRRQ